MKTLLTIIPVLALIMIAPFAFAEEHPVMVTSDATPVVEQPVVEQPIASDNEPTQISEELQSKSQEMMLNISMSAGTPRGHHYGSSGSPVCGAFLCGQTSNVPNISANAITFDYKSYDALKTDAVTKAVSSGEGASIVSEYQEYKRFYGLLDEPTILGDIELVIEEVAIIEKITTNSTETTNIILEESSDISEVAELSVIDEIVTEFNDEISESIVEVEVDEGPVMVDKIVYEWIITTVGELDADNVEYSPFANPDHPVRVKIMKTIQVEVLPDE